MLLLTCVGSMHVHTMQTSYVREKEREMQDEGLF